MRQPKSCRSTSSTSKLSIMAAVGRRTLPYRLNTGMPSSGSLKSGDSIMLSCLSPRKPCWGPKAAVSRMSGSRARASREWVRSSVTEAGCASRAKRQPCRDWRSAGCCSRRSIANFMTTLRRVNCLSYAFRAVPVVTQRRQCDGSRACPEDVATPSKTARRRHLP